MSDTRSDPPAKKRPQPSWLDEFRDRLAAWIDGMVNPPIPVPVPVPTRRPR